MTSRELLHTPHDRKLLDCVLRPCRAEEQEAMLTIINEAAQAYRGRIPDDCWHEPYMPADALRSELRAGVAFTACEVGGVLAGIMGIQPVRNVHLIRHAYVLPRFQGRGVGGALMRQLLASGGGQRLVGTWAGATWAIAFYERRGFRLTSSPAKERLLRAYWTVSDRQIAASVVLASPRLTGKGASDLIKAGAQEMPGGRY